MPAPPTLHWDPHLASLQRGMGAPDLPPSEPCMSHIGGHKVPCPGNTPASRIGTGTHEAPCRILKWPDPTKLGPGRGLGPGSGGWLLLLLLLGRRATELPPPSHHDPGTLTQVCAPGVTMAASPGQLLLYTLIHRFKN